ncbi:rRNA biogenesis protein RRP5 like [Verticillium longisporum]|nr:rRNA biogenesis protein RRP5 like [Verticillium longisporum]
MGTDNLEDSEDEQDNADSDEDVDEDGDVDMSREQNGLSNGKYDWAGDAFDDSDKETRSAPAKNSDSDDEQDKADSDEDVVEDGDVDMSREQNGLSNGKYDWAGDAFDDSDKETRSAPAKSSASKQKETKKPKKDEIQVDRTAALDVNGPQTASDYERLLLGQPDSSALWIAYMALQMQVSELTKAREIAERAIKTINIREQTEKLNVWIAYLNLEVAYGTKTTVEEVFQRACQYNDDQEIRERLATIYIQSGKHKKADELFQATVAKFGSKNPNLWTNYAHFLHATLNQPDRARSLLPRATQALGEQHTAALMAKFGSLEFRSPNGDAERGRTTFETLLATWPKRFDLWNQLRGTKVKGLKAQRAMKWFKRWAEWEGQTDPKGKERVMAKAAEWVTAAKARKEAGAAEDEDME